MAAAKINRAKIRHNERYDKNERKIQRALLKLLRPHRGSLSAQRVARAAGVSRQTFYNHHPNINQAIMAGEKNVLDAFIAELDIQNERLVKMIPDANKRIFYTMFIFISQHEDIFCPICADINNQGVLYRMLRELYPKLEVEWLPKGSPAPSVDSERIDRYFRVAVGIICRWGANEHCDIKRASYYIKQLLNLTEDISRKV